MSQRGSLRKRGDTWTAYWWIHDAEGKRRQRTKGGFRTKRDAQAHLTTVLSAVQTGTYVEPRKITVAIFLRDEWLPTLTQRNNTKSSYRTTAESWIIPTLGGIQLANLTPAHVQGLLEHLRVAGSRRGTGLAPRSVQYALKVLKMALTYAVAQGFIPRSPATAIKRPQAQAAEMQSWTADEAAAFLDHVADDRLYAAWLLFLQRGLRRGEIAGLRWSDVDLDSGRLSIGHTRVLVEAKAESSAPKTGAGRRTIPLSPRLVATVRAHRRRQLEERMAWGEAWEETGYVFTRQDGRPLYPEYFSTAFERHVRKLGARRIRLHDTRHTCASLALQAGEKTEVVSRWLGHASVSITQDIYQHVIPSMIEEAGERLDDIVFSRRKNPQG